MLTQHEREAWFRDPVTQAFVQHLRDMREQTKENWACQVYFKRESREETERLNLYALAGVEILDQVVQLVEENRPQTGVEG